jgi:hypothetical protein
MMRTQHKRENTTLYTVEPNEGERTISCCNKSGIRSPSLDLEGYLSPEEKKLIEQLAEILTEAIISEGKNESSK